MLFMNYFMSSVELRLHDVASGLAYGGDEFATVVRVFGTLMPVGALLAPVYGM